MNLIKAAAAGTLFTQPLPSVIRKAKLAKQSAPASTTPAPTPAPGIVAVPGEGEAPNVEQEAPNVEQEAVVPIEDAV